MKDYNDLFSLKGKVALITGSRRGIGRAIALMMAKAGADIAVCDYVSENGDLEKTVTEIKNLGRKCTGFTMNVSVEAQVIKTVQAVAAQFGRIDILVNNAGISPGTPIPMLPESEWDQVMDTNVKGCYLCSKAAIPFMVQNGSGSIINISSIEGLSVAALRRGSSSYGVSKAGIILLTHGLAWDLGKFNIRANAIAPGGVKTDMLRYLWDPSSLTPETIAGLQMLAGQRGVQIDAAHVQETLQKMITTSVPLGRLAEPEEIASAALFLASDAASYITGQTLIVDGGLLA